MRVKDAKEILNERKIPFVVDKEIKDEKTVSGVVSVSYQEPSAGNNLEEGQIVKLFVKELIPDNETSRIIPDVKNMSLRKAINKLVSDGFLVDVNGSGEIIDVYPKPGSKAISKSKVILFCKDEN